MNSLTKLMAIYVDIMKFDPDDRDRIHGIARMLEDNEKTVCLSYADITFINAKYKEISDE